MGEWEEGVVERRRCMVIEGFDVSMLCGFGIWSMVFQGEGR